jgi:hypothetical protein
LFWTVVVIPAQKTRDLLDREAAHEHVAQLVQLRIRPFPLYGRRFGVRAGRLWIEDRGADQAQQRFVLGISWPAEEMHRFLYRSPDRLMGCWLGA